MPDTNLNETLQQAKHYCRSMVLARGPNLIFIYYLKRRSRDVLVNRVSQVLDTCRGKDTMHQIYGGANYV